MLLLTAVLPPATYRYSEPVCQVQHDKDTAPKIPPIDKLLSFVRTAEKREGREGDACKMFVQVEM
jgi:hypothetical protein